MIVLQYKKLALANKQLIIEYGDYEKQKSLIELIKV